MLKDIEMRIYFYVPFIEKDNAKSMGMKWEPHMKLWYLKHIEEDSSERYLKSLNKPKLIYDEYKYVFDKFKYHSFKDNYLSIFYFDDDDEDDKKEVNEYTKLYENADKYFTQIYFVNEHKNEQKQKKINNKELQFIEE